jgi:hypothetical protein
VDADKPRKVIEVRASFIEFLSNFKIKSGTLLIYLSSFSISKSELKRTLVHFMANIAL